jgi:hypothetical protein
MKDKIKTAIAILLEAVNEPDEKKDLLTLNDAVAEFNISKSHLLRLGYEGKVKMHRLSPRKLFVSRAEIEAVIMGNSPA